jgi:hypothetical protein
LILLLQITKCIFHKFGPSGTVMKFDGLCVLPLNIINEKIYIFLWFWFLLLALVTMLQLVYRLAVVLVPCLRATLLKVPAQQAEPREQVRARLVPHYKVVEVCRQARCSSVQSRPSSGHQTRVSAASVLRRIPPYTEEMLNPSVFPPYSGIPSIFGHFWAFLAIFWAFLTFLNEVKKKNPLFFGLFS